MSNYNQIKVWSVAERYHLTALLEYYCGDYEEFCDRLAGKSDEEIKTAIESLTF